MVQVKEAVKNSYAVLGDVFSVGDRQDVRLEEVTLSDDEKYWLVTFSYIAPEPAITDAPKTALEHAVDNIWGGQIRRSRVTKTVKLRAEDGTFLGVKNAWD